MFSFHKPKIYRSVKGCCICRAKSSSSRFTDSKRYENDFDKCFKVMEKRAGEICNACVLLVKRWKKLPSGSNRNWHHVVDARAGPGTKSILKMKSKNREEKRQKFKKHKHKKPSHKAKPPQSPGGLSDDIIDDGDSHSSSPLHSDCSDDERPRKDKSKGRRKKGNPVRISSFLDLTYWKKTEICCGIIFKGVNGEVLVDTKLLRPCRSCKPSASPRSNASEEPYAADTEDVLKSEPLTPPPHDDPVSQDDDYSQDMAYSQDDDEEDEEESMDVGLCDSLSHDSLLPVTMDSTVTMTPESTLPPTPGSTTPSTPTSPTRTALDVLDLSLPGRSKVQSSLVSQAHCIQLEV